MGYREIYEYIEDHGETSVSILCKKFDMSAKRLLELLRPLIISHKLTLNKDSIKYTPDNPEEEIPE